MRLFVLSLLLTVSATRLTLPCASAQSLDYSRGPSNDKAQKTYQHALEWAQKHNFEEAFDNFKKADKQDGGHCIACQANVLKYGLKLRDWKAAESAANALLQESQEPKDQAIAHWQLGLVFFRQGLDKHKDEPFTRAHDELTKALQLVPDFKRAIFMDGQALAYLKKDDDAKARFNEFVKLSSDEDVDRQRALRYINEPELARARMAPPFSIVTLDGQHLSFDDLQGKVVLIDFWATWCGPCRASIPHMREIAKKFQDQPFVILSVSLDSDEQKWKDFVAQNGMTWLHYRDGGFRGALATLFAVSAIPHTFTVDADGVLQDEHIGDASIEGKLKKLIARAKELQSAEKPVAQATN